MQSKFQDLIQLFSVWATLFPIFVCILIIKKGSREIRLFFLFYVIGFLTDISMYSLKKAGITQYMETLSSIYSLVEASFFYWLIKRNVKLDFKSLVGWLTIISFLYWIGLALFRVYIGPGYFSVSQLFDPVYATIVSFFSGFIILKMVEELDTVSDKPMFWIFIGIFFYCFSTFFITTFLNSIISLELWFLHNIYNIITLGFYTFGLWRYYKIQKMGSKIKGV